MASQATVTAIGEEGAIVRMPSTAMGLRECLGQQADNYSIPIHQAGPARMPLVLVVGDESRFLL